MGGSYPRVRGSRASRVRADGRAGVAGAGGAEDRSVGGGCRPPPRWDVRKRRDNNFVMSLVSTNVTGLRFACLATKLPTATGTVDGWRGGAARSSERNPDDPAAGRRVRRRGVTRTAHRVRSRARGRRFFDATARLYSKNFYYYSRPHNI